jgi:hypothetical protein
MRTPSTPWFKNSIPSASKAFMMAVMVAKPLLKVALPRFSIELTVLTFTPAFAARVD